VSAASPSTRSLPALAARAQLGDRAALEELLRRLQPALGAHVRSLVRDDDLADDVLQNTLIILCRRLGTVRQTEWIRAWVYRVATREAFRALRRVRSDHAEFLDEIASIPDSSRDELGDDTEDLLAELPGKLATLPAGAQVVLRLHYLEAFTQQEVAEVLEIPIGTVKSRLAYGLMCLRRTWVV
jgi:RNA polymerase sigma-70 factor (ECF subfamily)